jgi:hypothetical protein
MDFAFNGQAGGDFLIRPKNPRPLGGVRVIWLCLKNAFEIAVAKP